jgi:hypothetical protein
VASCARMRPQCSVYLPRSGIGLWCFLEAADSALAAGPKLRPRISLVWLDDGQSQLDATGGALAARGKVSVQKTIRLRRTLKHCQDRRREPWVANFITGF